MLTLTDSPFLTEVHVLAILRISATNSNRPISYTKEKLWLEGCLGLQHRMAQSHGLKASAVFLRTGVNTVPGN
jgi:hypothetical protein